jgi:hypothetical protein
VDRVGVLDVEEERGQIGQRERRERRHRARELCRRQHGEQVFPCRLRHRLLESLRLCREVLGHEQQARDVLGALDVPPHPVNRVGDARQHQPLRRGASTQVSLLPPPCDEFTT